MTTQSPKHTDLPSVDKITPDNKEGNSPSSPEPSHIMTGDYVALMETNGKECESWYYFIRYQGNEEALQHLQDQLEKVDWYILDDLSTFDLDLEHFVSAKTAKEMTKLELNSYAFHRKFDGKLDKINFNFRTKDLRNNERMMCKVFDQLGYGQIEDYISDEDLDPEDLTDHESSSEETDTEEESDSDSEEESEEKEKSSKGQKKGLPASLMKTEIPRWAKAKKRKQRNHHK
jgi:hypothetical protein